MLLLVNTVNGRVHPVLGANESKLTSLGLSHLKKIKVLGHSEEMLDLQIDLTLQQAFMVHFKGLGTSSPV